MDYSLEAHLKEQWQILAEPVKNAIVDGRYKQVIKEATANMLVSKEHVVAIEMEVLMVLLDIQPKEKFEQVLVAIEGLHAETAVKVASFVQTHLFSLLAPFLGTETSKSSPQNEAEVVEGLPTSIAVCIKKDSPMHQRLTRLPENVQNVIRSPAIQSAHTAVAKKYGLDDVMTKALCDLSARVIVGLDKKVDYKKKVLVGLVVPSKNIDEFMTSMEDTVFIPIQKALVTALGATGSSEGPTSNVQSIQNDASGDGKPKAAEAQGEKAIIDPYREPVL